MKSLPMYMLLLYLVHQGDGAEPTYTSKYDGVNLDEILESTRLLNGYINCLMDAGACTPDGKELKKNLPDAISNDCSKCTDRQKQGADQVMYFIIENRPDDWDKLEKKYNSDGSYKSKYMNSKKTPEENDNKVDNKLIEQSK